MPTERKRSTTTEAPVVGTKRPRGRQPRRATTWQDRLLLNPDDTLRQAPNTSTGNLGQQDVEHYEVIVLTPPFRTSYWLVQKDIAGNVLVEARW